MFPDTNIHFFPEIKHLTVTSGVCPLGLRSAGVQGCMAGLFHYEAAGCGALGGGEGDEVGACGKVGGQRGDRLAEGGAQQLAPRQVAQGEQRCGGKQRGIHCHGGHSALRRGVGDK